MSDADRVTIKAFNTTDEAKDAERLLLDHGLNKDVVSRKGKKLRVTAEREDEARSILGAGASGVFSSDQAPVSTVVDGVQTVAGKVADATQSAASTVSDTVQTATSTVSDTVQSVTTTVVDQVGGVVDAAGERVAELAVTVREYGADGSGVQRQVARTTAGALDRTAYYLRQGDINIVLDDLRAAIRRSPGRSLLVGLGLGYLARTSFGDATTNAKSTRDAKSSLDA
jgi:hypothetical protein